MEKESLIKCIPATVSNTFVPIIYLQGVEDRQSCLEKIKDLQIAAQDGWKKKEFPRGPRV